MKQSMSRVIRDTADASRDYYIPTADAQRLYQKGKLIQYPSVYGNGEVCYGEKHE